VSAEGWYCDPYRLHQHRWFSNGAPTGLVRDGSVEAHDAAPPTPFDGPLVAIEGPEVSFGSDLRRADEAEAGDSEGASDLRRADEAEADGPFDQRAVADAVLDALGRSASED
jgi:hypothetical protein